MISEARSTGGQAATAGPAPISGDYPEPLDAAKAVVAAHPALIDLDSGTAAAMASLIAGAPGLSSLATTISSQGPASPTGGWATQTKVGGLGTLAVTVDALSSATAQAALAPVAAGIAAVRSEPAFDNVVWMPTSRSAGGSMVVEPPGAGFTWTVDHVAPRFGVDIFEISGNVATRTCRLVLGNAFPRFLGVFVEFLDGEGTPVEVTSWPSRLPTALSSTYETSTRKYVTVLPPTARMAGLALPGGDIVVEYAVPPEAAGARIVFAGGGVAGWEPAAGLGLTLTAVLGWALLGILRAAGLSNAYAGLIADPAIVSEALVASGGVAGASDVLDALGRLAAGVGPWLFGDELPLLRSRLQGLMTDTTLAAAAATLPWPAILAALSAPSPAGAVGVQALIGPATFTVEVPLELVTALTVTIAPDPLHGVWPGTAATVTTTVRGDQISSSASAPVPGPMADQLVSLSFAAMPADRPALIDVQVQDAGGRASAAGTAVVPRAPGARTATVTVTEPAPPPSTGLRFQHAANLSWTAGRWSWEAGPVPTATEAALDCRNEEGALCELSGITLAADARVLGCSWQAAGQNVPSCDGQSIVAGQASVFQCLSYGADPTAAAKALPCAFDGPALLVFARSGGSAAFVDPRGGTYSLRPVSLDPSVPFDIEARVSIGRFPIARPTDVVLDPDGLAAGVSAASHLLQIVHLADAPVPDAEAPVAFATGGLGAGLGQLDLPVAVAVGTSGAFVVLEAGNRRLQAFDRFGNPLPYFAGGLPTLPLAGDAQPRTYLDLDIDDDGTLYVLSHAAPVNDASDYRVDVLAADGTALTSVIGMAAARIAVAPYRTLYALGYGALAGPGLGIQPAVGVWIAAEGG